jgi:hypothetical protein
MDQDEGKQRETLKMLKRGAGALGDRFGHMYL